MTNLLNETIDFMVQHGKSPEDVVWVGNHSVYSTWENFLLVANTDYNAGFGSQQVAGDLIIVGKDWWLERYEYDGSEHWVFQKYPKKPKEKISITALTTDQAKSFGRDVLCGWNDLSGLNKEE